MWNQAVLEYLLFFGVRTMTLEFFFFLHTPRFLLSGIHCANQKWPGKLGQRGGQWTECGV